MIAHSITGRKLQAVEKNILGSAERIKTVFLLSLYYHQGIAVVTTALYFTAGFLSLFFSI